MLKELFGFLFILSFLLFSVSGEDFEHLENVDIVGVPCESNELTLSFIASGKQRDIELIYNPRVFHDTFDHDAHFLNSDGTRTQICAYASKTSGVASAVFLNGELHKVYIDEGVSFEIERTHHYYNRRAQDYQHHPEDIVRDGSSKFVMTRTLSAMPDDIYCGNHAEGHDESDHAHTHFQRLTNQNPRPALTTNGFVSPAPSPCPSSLKRISLGIASDFSFFNLFGSLSATQAEIVGIVQFLSDRYTETLNIQIALGTMDVRQGTDSDPWNTGDCGGSSSVVQTTRVSNQLDRFTNWRGSQTNYGQWHLLTNCWSSGNVGLAWTGVTCIQGKVLNGGGPGYFSNTGLSSYIAGVGHLVTTHELGHQFGAPHDDTTYGIMISCFCGTNEYGTFSSASQTAMCSKSGLASCLTTGVSSGSTTTAATQSTSTTVSTTVSIGGSTPQAQMVSALNAERARYGSSPVSWSASAESYANSYATSCNWGSNFVATQSNTLYIYGAYPQSPTRAKDVFNNALSNGRAGYTCSTDSCSNSDCSYAYRSWIASTTTGFACVNVACGANTAGPWPGQAWDFTICSSTPYAVYSGQRAVSSCGAKRSTPDCSSACEGRNCGTVQTECGEVICGSGECDAGSTCVDGLCSCDPLTTCAWRDVDCGNLVGNCGQQVRCRNDCHNQQPCQPKAAADVCGSRVCGSQPDGCGGIVLCGSCQESELCNKDGQCFLCDKTCHPLATCSQDDQTCQCLAGYEGDGYTCLASPAPSVAGINCASQMWIPYFGSDSAFFVGGASTNVGNNDLCSISHAVAANPTADFDAVLFDAYVHSTDGGDTMWTVDILRQSGSVGIIAGADPTTGDHFQFYWSEIDGRLYFASQSSQSSQHFNYSWAQAWDADAVHTLSVVLRADGSVIVGFDGTDLQGVIVKNWQSVTSFGLLASADSSANFRHFTFRSSAQFSLTLSGCWTSDMLIQMVTLMLNIDPTQVSADVTCNNDGTSSATLLFSDGQSSSSRTRAITSVANTATLYSRFDTILSSGTIAQGSVTGLSPAFVTTAPVSTVGGSSGLSGGQIAGIVVGSVCGGILVIGGVAYLVLAHGSDDDDDDVYTPDAATPQARRSRSWSSNIRRSLGFKRRGVNVMEHDPTKHQSITGRNPNIAK